MTANYDNDTVHFPAYGLMNSLYQGDITGGPLAPPDWRANTDSPATTREEAWRKWRHDTLALIAEVLWPIYNPATHAWEGNSSAQMEELTRADLALLLYLQNALGGRELDKTISSPVRTLDCPTHRILFEIEDNEDPSQRVSSGYAFYDRNVGDKFLKAFPILGQRAMTNKAGSVDLQFKNSLQRPRPFQMALRLGVESLSYELAITSMTPSIPCGHCIQALALIGGIMERLMIDKTPLLEDSWLALEQYAVDFGDRRVMAGVHYPSDNIASWIIIMRLAKHIYSEAQAVQVKMKLWNAISTRSFVYKAIQHWVGQGKGDPYARPFKALQEAADM